MIGFNELKKGIRIIINSQPYEIIEASHLFKGRGQALLQAKIKNLIDNRIIARTFRPSESFPEAKISEFKAKFLYSHRGRYFFCEIDNPAKRFELNTEQLGQKINFLKEGQEVTAQIFKERIINIQLPIKIQLKVTSAPPGIKGNRSQSPTKVVVLETGFKINTPLFIKEGDVIEVNTETGEYVKRI